MYIYENSSWPDFKWDNEILLPLISKVRHRQGIIIGKMESLGFELKKQANLETLTLDIIKTSEIEGEQLNSDQVRSSVARHLGLEISGLIPSDRHIDGIVEMILEATENRDDKLTEERLFSWHSSLFPAGYSGLYKITTGRWRDDAKGPMQVVSGPAGKEKIFFQAPDAAEIENEINKFLKWFNNKTEIDPVLKAGIAHLWFVTLHPFEDGNGRIARAITDMMLSRSDGQAYRFYSMSTQIKKERNEYYDILENTQKGNLDITKWLIWFFNCLYNALESSDSILSNVIFKHNFWMNTTSKIENDRQRKILNMLLEGFDGKLNTSKWAKICRCSQDTALRDIQDLVNKKILYKLQGGGRSTSYDIVKNVK